MLRCMAVSESLTSTISSPSRRARAVLNLATSAPTTRGHSSTASARRWERFMPLRRKSSFSRSPTGLTPFSDMQRCLEAYLSAGDSEQGVVSAWWLGARDKSLRRVGDEVEQVGAAGGIEFGGEVVDQQHGRLAMTFRQQAVLGHLQRQCGGACFAP